jgi:hypothetical protein
MFCLGTSSQCANVNLCYRFLRVSFIQSPGENSEAPRLVPVVSFIRSPGTHVSDIGRIFHVPSTNGAVMAPTTATNIAIFQRLTLRWFSRPRFSASSAIGNPVVYGKLK